MSGLTWRRAKPPSSLSVQHLQRIQQLIAVETGENYHLSNLRRLPVAKTAGSLLLWSDEDLIEGVLWAMNIDHQTIRVIGFCIDKQVQRMGHGSRGWKQMGEIAKSSGRTVVYLEVKADNEVALQFYRNNGLSPAGVLSTYYQGDPGLLMLGDL